MQWFGGGGFVLHGKLLHISYDLINRVWRTIADVLFIMTHIWSATSQSTGRSHERTGNEALSVAESKQLCGNSVVYSRTNHHQGVKEKQLMVMINRLNKLKHLT